MLLQFSVKNFRSFQKEETLNLSAGKGSKLLDSNTFEFTQNQRLVRSAVIYGPNSGGKSNLIKALHFLQQFVLLSSTTFQEGQKIPLQPFRLTTTSTKEPSEFVIDFVCDQIRFTYHLALTEERVITEELYAYPKKHRQTWFTRNWESSSGTYTWYQGPGFKGEHKAWEQMTRANALYLSTAVQFNSEQLKPIFLWFRDQSVILLKANPIQETHFNPDRTQRWFKALRDGLLLFVDELDLHLHPSIVKYLIELFHNPKTNQKNAQLVFTTHDTSLLDSDLFRRDQVWFIQKDETQSSHLYSLLDFKPIKGESIGKGYLQGRYGALPFIGKFRFS